MSELITAFHAIGDGLALVALVVLAWAAFFFVGPVACAVLVLLRAAGMAVPEDAPLLFVGSAAAWLLALACSLIVRVVQGAWQSMRAGRDIGDAAEWAAAGAGGGPTPPPSPFSFSLRDPWVAWAAAEAKRIRREGGGDVHAERPRTAGAGSRRTPPRGARPQAAPPPRGAPPPRAAPPPRPAPRPPEVEPHVVLGVPRGASAETIRKAYRELVKKHHPDKVTDRSAAVRKAAHVRILEIRRAYDALKEPRRR